MGNEVANTARDHRGGVNAGATLDPRTGSTLRERIAAAVLAGDDAEAQRLMAELGGARRFVAVDGGRKASR